MIQESDIASLLSQWKERLSKSNNSKDYNCALGECIYDLQNAYNNSLDYQDYLQDKMSHIPLEELEEYFLEQQAEESLSAMDFNEQTA